MDKNSNEYKELFKSQEERIMRQFGNEITLLDIEFGKTDYIKDATFVLKHNCEKCGNSIYKRGAYTLYKRKTVGCSNCKNPEYIKNYKFKELKQQLLDNNMYDYKLLDIEKPKDNTHWIMHLQHICDDCKNNIFDMRTDNCFSNNNRCPICSKRKSAGKSLGEEKIEDYCIDNNLEYIRGYYLPTNMINSLYDFYINDIVIEYDGSTHFRDCFNDPTKLIKQKDCDKRKTQWCLDNNKNFLRIPYTEFDNIENILNAILEDKDHHLLEQYDIFYINHHDMILKYDEDGIYSELINNIKF